MLGFHFGKVTEEGTHAPRKVAPGATCFYILVLAAVYFGAARLSLFLALEHTNASPVWPPAGIALAAVLLLGYRVGPGVLLGAFAANLLVLEGLGFPLSSCILAALSAALGNTLEAFSGAWLIRRLNGDVPVFESVRSTFVFVVFGAFLSAIIGATVGVAGFTAAAGGWGHSPVAWLTWWLGDATGVVLVAPLFLAGVRWRPHLQGPGQAAEGLLTFVATSVVSGVVFLGNYPVGFLVLPFLLWTVLRSGLFETVLTVAVVSAMAIYGATRAAGTLTGDALNASLLLMQSYVGVVAVTALFVSVAVIERKRSSAALLASKAFMDTIIESVPGAFFVVDAKGHLVRWNRFLEGINDLSPRELGGMSSLRNMPEEDQDLIARKIREAFEKGESEAEGRIVGKDGMRYFLFTGRRIEAEGEPYVVGTGIDITDRKTAELRLLEYRSELEARVLERTAQLTEVNDVLASEIEERTRIEKTLTESEAKYRDLVESANSVILRWTNTGSITFINKFAQRFFGYSEDEIIGRNIIGTIVPETESSGRDLSSLTRDVFEHPEAYVLNENENTKKNGDRVWVAWTNKPIRDELGEVKEILSVGNDVTDRKLAEMRLKRTMEELGAAKERAEAADHLKSAFLATMSHELRTPLNSIIGFTGIILQGYVGPLNEEQTKQLGMVRSSANHLLSLINDVLDISKIEARQLQVSREAFDLPAMVERAVQSSRPAADKKGLSLTVTIAPEVGAIVSDPRRVEQILLNLLSNAIKFTDHGGVKVEGTQEGGFVITRVSDTGIGIKEENMAKLFKAFQQIDTGTMRKYEGTGLGLYICQRLVELLGGRIWLASTWGAGSTFSFSLPDERGVS